MSESKKTFSQKLHRLEEIVTLLDKPDVELEDGLALLEEGVALHQDCQKMLSQTEAKINTLLAASVPNEVVEKASDEPLEPAINVEATLFSFNEEENIRTPDDPSEDLPF